jgi:large subunit ribosomal protein L19
MNAIQKMHRENLKTDIPEFNVGDTVRANVRIIEGGKERIQTLTGTVIARNGGGIAESVTIRRVSYGQGLEHVLPLHSPRVAGFEVVRQGSVRRAKLYYIRERQGKSARIREKV